MSKHYEKFDQVVSCYGCYKLALQDPSPSGLRPSAKSGERKRPRTSLGRWDMLSYGQREGGEVKGEDMETVVWFVLC